MKKFNNTIIIGIDHGYGNMKTANCCEASCMILPPGAWVGWPDTRVFSPRDPIWRGLLG